MSSNDKRLTLLGHLAELRTRLIRSVIVLSITTILAFVFVKPVFDLLTYRSTLTGPVFDVLVRNFHLYPPPDIGNSLVYIDMTEMVGTYMKVCVAAGIILAVPYLLYEFVMFVSPALSSREKRYVYIIFPWVTFMFVLGVLFSYFILLPPAIRFLFSFGTDIAIPQVKIGSYISTVTRLILAVGLIFELPVVTSLLARLGVVKPKWLAGKRKWAVIIAFVVGGIITPTVDPIDQLLVALPIIVLYELSIWLSYLAYRKKSQPVTAT